MRFEVEAILFDIDGTLVDSTAVVERIWRTWARRRGLDAAEILRVCHGRRSQDTVAQFLPREQQAEATDELLQLELQDVEDVVALPGAAALLGSLPGDRWAAVTSGSRELMAARLGAADLPVPSVLVAGDDVSHGKPDPEGYLAAAARLEKDIRRCLVIEDAPAGLAAGLASGARLLAVTTSHEPSELTRAEVVVRNLTSCVVEHSPHGLVVTAEP